MNAFYISRSPIKDNQKTSLSIHKASPIPKNPKKSKSQINIRKKSDLNSLNQELETLKLKIQASKGILSTIYSKVKKKESHYENQISQKDLYLYRAKQMISDYKNLYQNGLKDMEKFVDRNRAQGLSQNQHRFSKGKLQELKKSALEKAKGKFVDIQQSQFSHQKKESQRNLQQSQINQSVLKKKTEQVLIHKMMKSHSEIYQKKTKSKFEKVKPSQKKKMIKQKSTINKQKPKNESQNQKLKYEDKLKGTTQKFAESKQSQYDQQKAPTDDKKSLYEIYKERILKRQKQQNSDKMNWIVEKLQENINDLQLIRKKSQLKLSKYSPLSQNHSLSKKNKVQNAESFDRNERQQKFQHKRLEQKMKKQQKSRQKLLQINKNHLKRINESIPK